MVLIISGVIASLLIFKPWKSKDNGNWIQEADKSVLFVTCYDSSGNICATGSGFLLFDDSTVVTNYHVIEGIKTVKVYTYENVEYDVANVRSYSKEQDIAILELSEATGRNPLTVGDSTIVNKGDEVTAIGSPEGFQNTVSTGVLSGRVDNNGCIDLQITAPISHGSSGGALFNSKGEVIGITYSGIDASVAQNINFAIPIEEAVILYNDVNESKTVAEVTEDNTPWYEEISKAEDSLGGVEKVSFDQLMASPQKYENRAVCISAYISSIGNGAIITSSEEYIDDDYENDWVSSFDISKYPFLAMDINNRELENIEIGIPITVIGVFYNNLIDNASLVRYHISPLLIVSDDSCLNGSGLTVDRILNYENYGLNPNGKSSFNRETVFASLGDVYCHTLYCKYHEENSDVIFANFEEAFLAGYIPCPWCSNL